MRTGYVLSLRYLAGVQSAEEGLPFVGHSPPATPMVVWSLLYPLVILGGAVLTFARRDL